MLKLNSSEIKKLELNILLKFDEFCKKHKLRYYLAGGTLLGAVRHKGFIPWDDDIDVCMPRPDYEKAVKLLGTLDNRYMLRSNHIDDFSAPFAKLVDLNTKIVSKVSNSNIESNLWIDIFPVDGLPDDIGKVKRIYEKCFFYRRMLFLCDKKKVEDENIIRKYVKYSLKFIVMFIGSEYFVNKLERIAMRHKYDSTNYVGIVTWGLYGVGERMLKSEFEKPIKVEFEGHKFPAFSCWDSYLRGLYKDYMKLPPLEKRQTHNIYAYIEDELAMEHIDT